tara:strand:+ start:1177 stop:2535 length:1359 start_codon:yes stop_codon:yes gene_type:complete
MKKFMVMCAPFTSRSGYGAHARDLFHAFYNTERFDIKLMDVRWGACPQNALNKDNKKDKLILDCILPMPPQIDKQPDIYVDIRIPNEFETHGKFNIGITAGVETTAVSEKWIEGCNKMDLVIVPSEHSKSGFVNSVYDKVQNLPDGKQEKIGELKLEKPMEVLFEGVDEDIFKVIETSNDKLYQFLDKKIKEDFNFLFVGQWVKGEFGEDRKDVGRLIKVFYESFANQENQPALILKTSGATFSILDREEILKKVRNIKNKFPSDFKLPNVYVLHGDLTDNEINLLYNHPKIKVMASFTHGEGFGRPLLEATMVGLPVIASNWSGQVDFLDQQLSVLIGGDLKNVPNSAVWKDIIIPESQWFTIDENQAYRAIKYMYQNYDEVLQNTEKLMVENRNKFTLNKMTEKLDGILEQYTKHISTQVQMKLPKLKKKTENKSKLKLPKLKKITEEIV